MDRLLYLFLNISMMIFKSEMTGKTLKMSLQILFSETKTCFSKNEKERVAFSVFS